MKLVQNQGLLKEGKLQTPSLIGENYERMVGKNEIRQRGIMITLDSLCLR